MQPGFELFRGGFSWNTYWNGHYRTVVEDLGHIPFLTPDAPDSVEGEGLLDALVNYGKSHVRREYVADFKRDLDRKLNGKACVAGAIVQRRNEREIGSYFGSVFPTYADARSDSISDPRHLYDAQILCRLDDDILRLTMFINKPFISSWVRTVEKSLENHKRIEVASKFRISADSDMEMTVKLEDFLAGKATVASAGFAMRGFDVSSSSH